MADANGNGRQQGTVRWFNKDKGFGFLDTPGGQQVFVHYSDLKGFPKGERNLKEGQKVEFNLVQAEKGPKAEEVRVIE